jgi:spermidine/putrescine transport system substrate-binding protein
MAMCRNRGVTMLTGWVRAALLAAGILAVQGAWAAQEIVFYTWADYIDPEVVRQFERENAATVRQRFFDSDQDRNDRLLQTDGTGFDVMVVDEGSMGMLVRRGWLQPLDNAAIPNRRHVDEKWLNAVPEGPTHGVPYTWGILGIGYREDLVANAPTSWADLFNPEAALKGRILMLQDPRELVGMALKSLGHSANSTEPAELNAAEDLLRRQKPFVRAYSYINLTEKSALVTGKAAVAMVYNGDALTLQEINPRIRFVTPREGTSLWVDYLTVPSRATNKDLAYRFIDFLNRPEIAARNAVFTHYASPNRAAEALLPPEHLKDPVVYPPPEVLTRCEHLGAFPPKAAKARQQIYSRLAR